MRHVLLVLLRGERKPENKSIDEKQRNHNNDGKWMVIELGTKSDPMSWRPLFGIDNSAKSAMRDETGKMAEANNWTSLSAGATRIRLERDLGFGTAERRPRVVVCSAHSLHKTNFAMTRYNLSMPCDATRSSAIRLWIFKFVLKFVNFWHFHAKSITAILPIKFNDAAERRFNRAEWRILFRVRKIHATRPTMGNEITGRRQRKGNTRPPEPIVRPISFKFEASEGERHVYIANACRQICRHVVSNVHCWRVLSHSLAQGHHGSPRKWEFRRKKKSKNKKWKETDTRHTYKWKVHSTKVFHFPDDGLRRSAMAISPRIEYHQIRATSEEK